MDTPWVNRIAFWYMITICVKQGNSVPWDLPATGSETPLLSLPHTLICIPLFSLICPYKTWFFLGGLKTPHQPLFFQKNWNSIKHEENMKWDFFLHKHPPPPKNVGNCIKRDEMRKNLLSTIWGNHFLFNHIVSEGAHSIFENS